MRAAAERERLAEAVPRERERAEAAGREQVARREAQRAAQHLVGLRVVGRVAGLARPLLVGEPERVERVHVVAARAQLAWSFAICVAVSVRPAGCAAGDRGRSSPCGEPCRAPPRSRAVAVSPAAAPPISNLRAFMPLLQPGRRGPPAGRAPPSSGRRLGHLVALVRRRDVRERVARTTRRSRPRRRRAGCSGSCSAARTRRSGTCRSPARSPAARCRRRRPPSRRPFGKPQRSASSTASRSGAAGLAVPPGQAPFDAGLDRRVQPRAGRTASGPVKFRPGHAGEQDQRRGRCARSRRSAPARRRRDRAAERRRAGSRGARPRESCSSGANWLSSSGSDRFQKSFCPSGITTSLISGLPSRETCTHGPSLVLRPVVLEDRSSARGWHSRRCRSSCSGACTSCAIGTCSDDRVRVVVLQARPRPAPPAAGSGGTG